MSTQSLHQHLQNLHNTMADYPVDHCTAGTLKQIADDIALALAQAEGSIPVQSYHERLEQEAVRFSEEHPVLAQTIRQLMNALANMGI